jgi:hypothetical protein
MGFLLVLFFICALTHFAKHFLFLLANIFDTIERSLQYPNLETLSIEMKLKPFQHLILIDNFNHNFAVYILLPQNYSHMILHYRGSHLDRIVEQQYRVYHHHYL